MAWRSSLTPRELEELRRVCTLRQTSYDSSCVEQLLALTEEHSLRVLSSVAAFSNPIVRLSSYLKKVIAGTPGSPEALSSSVSSSPYFSTARSRSAWYDAQREEHSRSGDRDPPLPDQVEKLLDVACWSKGILPSPQVRELLASLGEASALYRLASAIQASDICSASDLHRHLLRPSAHRSEDIWYECPGSSQDGWDDCSSSSDEVWFECSEELECGDFGELSTSYGHAPYYSLVQDCRERALGNLDFWKRSLILQITGNRPEYLKLLTPKDLEEFGNVPLEGEKSFLCNLALDRQIPKPVGMTKKDWTRDANVFTIPECSVDGEGHCTYKGRSPFAGGNALQRVLGEDRVLRVQFEDAPGRDYDKYRRVLKNGIYLGLRHYVYFIHKETAKDKGKAKCGRPRSPSVKCFFVCLRSDAGADPEFSFMMGLNMKELRNYFCHIYQTPTIAKFIARQQILLTKTRRVAGIDLLTVDVRVEDDIHCLDPAGKDSCATDGAGQISVDLAKLLPSDIIKGQSLREVSDREDTLPLLAQVRMFTRGIAVKGTLLAVETLRPKTIMCRKSMVKVSRDGALSGLPSFNSLELVSTSRKPKEASLSKNLIMLLSHRKVPDSFFLQLAQDVLEDAKRQYSDFERLKKGRGGTEWYVEEVSRMLAAGMDPAKEFYLREKLNALAKSKYEDFYKGRLLMPKSWYLMGTADPTGTLKHGEIALILDDGPIICKQVLIYKNPGLHPGDINLKEATWNSHLEYAIPTNGRKNVLIFSTQGPRSSPEMIANSDLDGDLYWLTRHVEPYEAWEVPPKATQNNQIVPATLSENELEHELHEAFLKVRFTPSSTIGQSAWHYSVHMDRYLSLKDEREKGRIEQILEKIIDIHHEAVDSEKSGLQVDFPKQLKASYIPHYLRKESQGGFGPEVYHSTSIIGQMYDLIDSPQSSISPTIPVYIDPDFEYDNYQSYIQVWQRQYSAYRSKMESILKTNPASKDAECEELFGSYRKELYGAASLKESTKPLPKVLEEASAIYWVVYDHAIRREADKTSKWRSSVRFAWAVALHALCVIYAERQPGQPMVVALKPSKQKIRLYD